jgi:catechol 2,3-dioxygenase-like lactoylglutathione lyase family enzyme
MALKDILGEYGLVVKQNVSDLDKSHEWYSKKLDLKYDSRYTTPIWQQFFLPELTAVAIGLNLDPTHTGTRGATTTFVVDDINKARDELIKRGVEVGPIHDAGHGVKLAFFFDPDNNALGLRQNPPNPQ